MFKIEINDSYQLDFNPTTYFNSLRIKHIGIGKLVK